MDLGSILGKLDDNTDFAQLVKLVTDNREQLAKLGDHLDDSGAQARGFAPLG